MKKKMTVLGGLMMAVVLTGYSVAGTYAKYTESASVSDNAIVAKWDVTVGADASQLLFTTANNNAKVNNRVAPGGYDSADWTVVATDNGSEVKVDLAVSMDIENSVQKEISKEHYDKLIDAKLNKVVYTEGGKYYYAPVVFTLVKTSVDGTAATPEVNNHFPANNALTIASGDSFNISWKWAFEASELGTVSNEISDLINKLDTQLGKEHDPNKKIQINATASAVQGTLTRRTGAGSASVSTTANTNDVASLKAGWGYDDSKTAQVTFDGSTIGGTINKATNPTLLSKYPASDPVGYYYPITISGEPGTTVKMGASKMKTFSIGADGNLTVLMALDSVNKTPIKYSIGGGEVQTIDYSGLTFAE